MLQYKLLKKSHNKIGFINQLVIKIYKVSA